MKKGLTEIVAILDKSGSMGSVRDDALGGINTFIEDQKKAPGEALFTLVFFDSNMTVLYDGINIKEIHTLQKNEYVPSGNTALNDAICSTIDSVGKRLASMKEEDRPEKVLVAILTDGMENDSKSFTRADVKERIDHQREKYNWEFVFLAANQDAFATSEAYGISAANTVNYSATPTGTMKAMNMFSSNTVLYRSGLDMHYSDIVDEEVEEKVKIST